MTAPAGRLVSLGIVLDQRNDAAQTVRIAQMAERAGMQSLWVSDRFITADGRPRMEATTALAVAALYTKTIRVGGMFSTSLRTAASVAALAGSLDTVLGGRMELGVAVAWSETENRALGLPFDGEAERIAAAERFTRDLLRLLGMDGDGSTSGMTSPQPGGPPLTYELRHAGQADAAVDLADNVLLGAGRLEEVEGIVASVRETCRRRGRDPDTLGIAVELPVSVGRTYAESDARVEIDDLMSQMDTRTAGIHGTLERCQDIVIELAHLGVNDVRCVLPNVADIDDVIAQLSATTVGTKDVLKPGTERSEAPAPPPGWGGPPKVSTP